MARERLRRRVTRPRAYLALAALSALLMASGVATLYAQSL